MSDQCAGGYTPLVQMLTEIGKSFDAGAVVAALCMVYVCLDTLALLSCPVGQDKRTRREFIAWVDKYLKADPSSEYQYEGIDVYAARCAVLHSYGSESDLHRSGKPPRKFGYTDNGRHRKDDAENFALVSIAVLVHDFSASMERFTQDMLKDPDLKARVDSRIHKVLLTSILDHS